MSAGVKWILATLVTATLSAPTPAQDAEAALAAAQQARDVKEKIFQYGKPSPQETASRQDWAVRAYAGFWVAADIECDRIRALAQPQTVNEFLAAVTVFRAKYPMYGHLQAELAYSMARMANDKATPDDVRRKLLEGLALQCKDCSWVLHLTRNTLAAMKLTPAEKFTLARKGEETCGAYPYAWQYLWAAFEPYARTAEPAEVIAECERILARYPAGSDENIATRKYLLQTRVRKGEPGAAEQLKELAAAESALFEKADIIRRDVEAARKVGDLDKALRRAEDFRTLPRRCADSALMTALVREAARGTPDQQVRAFVVALDTMPFGQTAEDLMKMAAESSLLAQRELTEAALRWIARNAHDRYRDHHRCAQVVRRSQLVKKDSDLRRLALKTAADAMRRIGSTEKEADYLWELGVAIQDTDRPGAVHVLDRAAAACPGSYASARAAWLAAFLRGELSVEQSPLSRAPSLLTRDDALPAVVLPPAPAAAEDVTLASGLYTLRKLDPARSLTAGQRASVSSGIAAQNITDGKSDTFWKPEALPAAAVIALKERATVSKIVVKTVEPSGLLVSLLDAEGRPLARFDRVWNFWDQYITPDFFAPETLTLNVPPVSGVSYVRLDLINAMGAFGGLREVEAYSTAFPARAVALQPAQPLPPGARAVAVSWQAEQPEKETVLQADGEWISPWPALRWRTPWKRFPKQTPLRLLAGNTTIEFFGASVTLLVADQGKVTWTLDAAKSGVIEHRDKAITEHLLADNLPDGRHLLNLQNGALEAADDNFGPSNLEFAGLKIKGRATASVAVRFASARGEWGPWTLLAHPAGSTAKAADNATQFQTAVVFDSRSVRGSISATLTGLQVTAQQGSDVDTGATPAKLADLADEPSPLTEELDLVAGLVRDRRVVVAYAKTGTVREYEAAKKIADRAGLYLVSDDIGLNLYPGLVLSVGRPLTHRYVRLLNAMRHIWTSPAYLADADGVIGVQRGPDGAPAYLFVTGETGDAVCRAADRLLARIHERKAPEAPFRLFSSDILEMVYAWQLHPDRKAPDSLRLRMAQCDRRSIQFGLAADRELAKLDLICSPLRSEQGGELAAPVIRPVGFYEWVPFFGDLRLPNLLVDRPRLPVPANTALGVWLTVVTDATAKPGLYRGTLAVSSDTFRRELPVEVLVEPIAQTVMPKTALYSFAGVPYWFHDGSGPFDVALRALARNEAVHGVNIVKPGLRDAVAVSYAPSRGVVRWAVGPAGAGAGKPAWLPAGNAKRVAIAPRESLLMDFDIPVAAHQFYVTVATAKDSTLALDSAPEAKPGERIATLPIPADAKQARALCFEAKGIESRFWRLTNEGKDKLEIVSARAFTDPARTWPFAVDFARIDRQFDLFEQEYRAVGKPLPAFLAMPPDLRHVDRDLFDEGGNAPPLIQRVFAEQFSAHLKRTGRADRFYLKVADEPADIAVWAASAKPYLDGGLRTMTCHSDRYPNIDVAIGIMDPWCPNYQHNVLKPFFRDRQKAGDAFWWYCCGVPATRLTGSPIENLPFYWLTAKWRLDGAMNYAAMHASDYVMPVPFRYEHGMDHRIVFLADGQCLDTTRRELESEGIHDLKLIEYVRDRTAGARARGRAAAADAHDAELAKIIESVVPYKYGYPNRPEPWHKAREALYDLACRAAKL